MNTAVAVDQRAETIAILRAARRLVTPPEKWTTCAAARDATGRSVPPKSPMAVCFCASGAVQHVDPQIHRNQHGLPDPTSAPAWLALRRVTGQRSVSGTNDSGRHADVLALFDRAIARLEAGR